MAAEVCRNCGTKIVPDPTDPEDWVHAWSEDAVCKWEGRDLDSWAEPPSKVELDQAKVRLVRLDAEGNPVDGTVRYLNLDSVKFFNEEPETLDEHYRKLFQLKSVSLTVPLVNLDDETLKLLMGE